MTRSCVTSSLALTKRIAGSGPKLGGTSPLIIINTSRVFCHSLRDIGQVTVVGVVCGEVSRCPDSCLIALKMSYLHTHWRDVDVSVSICFALDVMHSPLPSSSALLPKGIWCLNYVTGGQFFFSL